MTLYDRARFLEIRLFALSRRARPNSNSTTADEAGGLRKPGFEEGYMDQVAFRNAKGFDMKYKVVAIRTR